nr:DUF397 domain-containing protein [Kibdelosporangium sp. MJ126-NF4]CEL16888.1 hypothetical protein [Kibdelosporangium sp. MJ126-NF4]CTQ91883.1 hypothetical protein [Kibdelosporangium sp. MJ126-NF4]
MSRDTDWFKSSVSGARDACVEVHLSALVVGVRDSKSPGTDMLRFPARQWRSFLACTRSDYVRGFPYSAM